MIIYIDKLHPQPSNNIALHICSERKKEILGDPRVQRAQAPRSEQQASGSNGASAASGTADTQTARQWIKSWKGRTGDNGTGGTKGASQNGAQLVSNLLQCLPMKVPGNPWLPGLLFPHEFA